MRTLKIQAVVVTDGENYFIHGSNTEQPSEMFKAMQPIWSFDPATETAHFVELEVALPEFEDRVGPTVTVTDVNTQPE